MRDFFRTHAQKRKRDKGPDTPTRNLNGTPVRSAGSPKPAAPLVFPRLNDEDAARLRKMHDEALPYKYVVLDPLLVPRKMASIQQEAKHNMRATLKETDLFRVYQTGDLGGMDAAQMQEMLPNLLELRTAIYSLEFRQFVQSVVGCGELTERVDCSANAYAQGCHLLCHDDVIGTRCVSYIIYLTDPDEPWTELDGGALELYALDPASIKGTGEHRQGVPAVLPAATVLPKFNSMLLFAVQPGRSYHSVQEVFTDRAPRLSISGWYHAAAPPVGADLASLKQILSTGDAATPYLPLLRELSVEADADTRFLLKYLNPVYLEEDQLRRVRKGFIKTSSVQLADFLCAELASRLGVLTGEADRRDLLGLGRAPPSYTVGEGSGWTAVGPPHKRRHLSFDRVKEEGRDGAGAAMSDVLETLMQSPVFARYLVRITTLVCSGMRGEVRRFRAGLDYSVAHFGGMSVDTVLDATLCFVDCAGDKAEAWEGGDAGGFECYIEADEDSESAEAAEVYRPGAEEEGSLLSVSPGFNVMSLVLRDEGIMRFVKYVGAQAPGSRWDVSVEYQIEGEERLA